MVALATAATIIASPVPGNAGGGSAASGVDGGQEGDGGEGDKAPKRLPNTLPMRPLGAPGAERYCTEAGSDEKLGGKIAQRVTQ